MTRSQFQDGPATDHYHNALGPEQTVPSGSISATDGTTTIDPATSIQFPAGTLVDGGSGVASVGLVLQVVDLGLLNFDDFDVNRYAVIGDGFVNGTIVIRMFQVPLVTWDFDAGEPLRNLNLGVAVGGDPFNNGQTLVQYPQPEDLPAYQGTFIEPISYVAARENGSKIAVSGYVNGSGEYFANFNNGGTPLTTGQSHVYAIIAIPA